MDMREMLTQSLRCNTNCCFFFLSPDRLDYRHPSAETQCHLTEDLIWPWIAFTPFRDRHVHLIHNCWLVCLVSGSLACVCVCDWSCMQINMWLVGTHSQGAFVDAIFIMITYKRRKATLNEWILTPAVRNETADEWMMKCFRRNGGCYVWHSIHGKEITFIASHGAFFSIMAEHHKFVMYYPFCRYELLKKALKAGAWKKLHCVIHEQVNVPCV